MSATEQLARFVVDHRLSAVPPHIIERAKLSILDAIGCAVSGYFFSEKECAPILDLIKEVGGNPEATIFLAGYKTSAAMAALANGAMVHSVDFDDTHVPSIAHLSASLVPTVFALGEKVKATGAEILEAYVAGFEVGAKVGKCMMPSHYRFFHPTATFGSLASVAAASKLLKLSDKKTEQALGLGADLAAGLRYCIDKGDSSKALHPGFAALRAIVLALLVAKGADGPEGILEYPTGFCNALCAEPRINEIVQGLGREYELAYNTFKAWPTILLSHAPIQALAEALREHGIDTAEIERVKVWVRLTAEGQGKNYDPQTVLAARLSIPFCLALVPLEGKVSLEQFTQEKLKDPKLREFMRKIEIYEDPSLNSRYPDTLAAVVEIDLGTKGTICREVAYPKGSVKNPMDREEVVSKFMQQCSGAGLDLNSARQVASYILELETQEGIDGVVHLLHHAAISAGKN